MYIYGAAKTCLYFWGTLIHFEMQRHGVDMYTQTRIF